VEERSLEMTEVSRGGGSGRRWWFANNFTVLYISLRREARQRIVYSVQKLTL